MVAEKVVQSNLDFEYILIIEWREASVKVFVVLQRKERGFSVKF